MRRALFLALATALTGCSLPKGPVYVGRHHPDSALPPLPTATPLARKAMFGASDSVGLASAGPAPVVPVTIEGLAGYDYTVESSPAVTGGIWTSKLTMAGTGAVVVVTFPTDGAVEFFRVKRTPSGWFRAVSATVNSDSAECVCEDASGDFYVAGTFAGNNCFVQKFLPDGTAGWRREFTGTAFPHGIAVRDGRVFVTGEYFGGNANFGGTNFTGGFYFSLFVAGYDAATGNHLWSRGLDGSSVGPNIGFAVSVASDGPVIGGSFYTLNFGDGTVYQSAASAGSAFVARFNASTGARAFSAQFGGNPSAVQGVAVDSANNIAMTGRFYGTMPIGSTTLTSPTFAGFVAKISSSGTHQWSRAFDSFTDPNRPYGGKGIAVATNGDVAITGAFDGQLNLGGATFTATSSTYNVFFARYDSTGSHLWSSAIGGLAGYGRAAAFAGLDARFAGVEYGPADFGGQTFNPSQGGFVASYTRTGTLTGLSSFSGNVIVNGVTSHGSAGKWSGASDFGFGTTNSVSGTLDAYLLKQ